jgi:hypothetical protein
MEPEGVHKSPPLIPIQKHMVHTLTLYFLTNHPAIILRSMPSSPKWYIVYSLPWRLT